MSLIPWRKKEAPLRKNGEGSGLMEPFGAEWGGLMDRFFEEPWTLWDRAFGGSGRWSPTLDVIEGDKEVSIKVELPGVDPKDFEISVLGRTLVVSGQKKSETEEKGRSFYRAERVYGSFRREIELPEGADPEKVSAEYTNGVLTLKVEKSKSATPKRIAVTAK